MTNDKVTSSAIVTAHQIITFCDSHGINLIDFEDCCRQLAAWIDQAALDSRKAIEELAVLPLTEWQAYILNHDAATHPWYDLIADKASLEVLQRFLWEESKMPPFVPILEAVMKKVSTREAKRALAANIFDELHPVPHSELFSQMIKEVLGTTGQTTFDATDHGDNEELAATNLVFYHCLVGPVDFAIGALYATELLVPRRALSLLRALKRLELPESSHAFMKVHSEIDSEHAAAWMDQVIVTETMDNPQRKREVAAGVATRLRTSAAYLTRLMNRPGMVLT